MNKNPLAGGEGSGEKSDYIQPTFDCQALAMPQKKACRKYQAGVELTRVATDLTATAWRCLPILQHGRWADSQPLAECEWAAAAWVMQ